MSQEKTLDNTQISNKDIKELEKGDTKLDNTNTAPKKKSTDKKTSSTKSSSNKSVVSAAKAMDPVIIGDITTALTNPENRKEFVYNIADLLGQTVRRKLTEEEINKLQNVVSEELIRDVFKV